MELDGELHADDPAELASGGTARLGVLTNSRKRPPRSHVDHEWRLRLA
jgi:hypothetical protein